MNHALVSVSTQLVGGPRALQAALASLRPVRVQKISSVYRRIEPATEGTLRAEILAVISLATELDLSQLKELIRNARADQSQVKWRLLSYNHEVRLEPDAPVPHPDLHLDPLILHCAAEIQGVFEHPVLGRSLQELVKSSQSPFGSPQFEFLQRGESLLGANSLEVP